MKHSVSIRQTVGEQKHGRFSTSRSPLWFSLSTLTGLEGRPPAQSLDRVYHLYLKFELLVWERRTGGVSGLLGENEYMAMCVCGGEGYFLP